MRVFVTKEFARFARREGISADRLCEAVVRAVRGLIDADLGGGVIKQRIARSGQGRSGGYRTIVAFHVEDRSVYMYGFAKNRKVSLTTSELMVYRQLAEAFLAATAEMIDRLMDDDELREIDCNDKIDAVSH